MRLMITRKNMEISEPLKRYVEKELGKLTRRAKGRSANVLAAVDCVHDKLQRQAQGHQERPVRMHRRPSVPLSVTLALILALVIWAQQFAPPAAALPVSISDMGSGVIDQRAPALPAPSLPLPPRTGYIPISIDLSHLQGDRMPAGMTVADLPTRWDWRDTGMVSPVGNQGACGSCYTFGFNGAFESRLLVDGGGLFNFSENYAKECHWEELNNYNSGWPTGSCDGGNGFKMANLYARFGTVQESCDPYVASDVECSVGCPYQKTLLGWSLISGGNIPDPGMLKAYIQTYGPVHTSLYAGDDDAWYTEFTRYDGSYTLYYTGTEDPNHMVLIVGWDDNLVHTGGRGGWIVKNSWGTGWGASGHFTIAYGSASIGTDSGFVSEWMDYDPAGGLLHYDEAGLNNSIGWVGRTTNWGLAAFTPPRNTRATRVEFWTLDATTDVDLYLYDTFDGSSLDGLLWSRQNLSFNEAGYHSVAVNPTVPLYTGNDVFVVVQITDANFTYPLPVDGHSPSERGRTFHSPDGSAGSWRDVGDRFSSDVGIRLRTGDTVPPSPTETTTPEHSPTSTHTPEHSPTPTHTPEHSPTPTYTPEHSPTPQPNVRVVLPLVMKRFGHTPSPTPTPFTGLQTLISIADATVIEGYPDFNAGDTVDMWAGYDDYLSPDGRIVRSLIKFNLSSLPANSIVQSARLRVYYMGYWDYPNHVRTVQAYQIVGDWTESGVTWNNRPNPGTGYGSVDIAANDSWGWRELDVRDLVQGWVNGSIANQGVMLRGPEASGTDSSYRSFFTREGDYPPQLVVNCLAGTAIGQPPAEQANVLRGLRLRDHVGSSVAPTAGSGRELRELRP